MKAQIVVWINYTLDLLEMGKPNILFTSRSLMWRLMGHSWNETRDGEIVDPKNGETTARIGLRSCPAAASGNARRATDAVDWWVSQKLRSILNFSTVDGQKLRKGVHEFTQPLTKIAARISIFRFIWRESGIAVGSWFTSLPLLSLAGTSVE